MIFVVDPDQDERRRLVYALKRSGLEPVAYADPHEALKSIDTHKPRVIISELRFPDDTSGLLFCQQKEAKPIFFTNEITAQDEASCLEFDAPLLRKNTPRQAVLDVVEAAMAETRREQIASKVLQAEQAKQAKQTEPVSAVRMVGTSIPIRILKSHIKRLANHPNADVLLIGETGTGKNLTASLIHSHSSRAGSPFVEINCAALPEDLLESELFGHKKGSFTGASRDKQGLLRYANGGTVFLDEIDSMSPSIQSKILSFLESRKFRAVGSNKPESSNVRLICATNADLSEKVVENKFREDLLYRINAITIQLPPLRDMSEDIEELACSLLQDISKEQGIDTKELAPCAIEKLEAYAWPGNVRELRNILERALVFSDSDQITAHDLHFNKQASGLPRYFGREVITLRELEIEYLQYVFNKYPYMSYSDMAERLGISRKTLWDKRNRYVLRKPTELPVVEL